VFSDGLSMAGNYKIPSGDCAPSDSGTWAATKFGDSSGLYSGQVTSAVNSRVITVLAAIQENSANSLEANVTLTNGGCSMLNLTGTAIGSVLQLENTDGTIAFVAQASDPTYASLATQYEIGGTSCGVADNGSGTLSKLAAAVTGRPKVGSQTNLQSQALLEKVRQNLHN
jgi:hypothetical protein